MSEKFISGSCEKCRVNAPSEYPMLCETCYQFIINGVVPIQEKIVIKNIIKYRDDHFLIFIGKLLVCFMSVVLFPVLLNWLITDYNKFEDYQKRILFLTFGIITSNFIYLLCWAFGLKQSLENE